MEFPILPCDLCGSQENLQRKVVGRMLDGLERERPGTKSIMLSALGNVRPSQLLDRELWSRLSLPSAAGLGQGEPSQRPTQLVTQLPSDLVPASALNRRPLA